ERLINDYPGRYPGTARFGGASELLQSRLGFGYQTSRQAFTWAGNRSSQNVIASTPGRSGKFPLLGAKYDTYYSRPTQNGSND
ncbi:autotransporter outer membrane beta-barrel domain-containing protein, partial [Pseudomonas aeruginosa]